jgi:diamine N-acetyltransferase
MLKGKSVYLRQVEPQDATKLLLWENDPAHWKVSDTEVPFSMHEIMNYIDHAHNIRANKQLRFIICLNDSGKQIGTIDLYEVSFKHGRAGIGILIGESDERSNGYASQSLELIIEYCNDMFGFHNLVCSIHADNKASINLFEKQGFEKIGVRKEWYLEKKERIDELLYQLCLKK